MNWWLNAARTILKISRNDDDSKWPVTISPGREGRGADKDIIGQQTRESRAQQERVKAASKNSALDAEY